MADQDLLLEDSPSPGVARLTLNRPEKRNALSNALRGALLDRLVALDQDEAVRAVIIRGAGPCFSAGYDLGQDNRKELPWHTASGTSHWARHVMEGWMRMWDLATPIIAQVHGHCLAGGSELATACDLVYCAEDAQIGYPPTRLMSPPDMQFHPWLVGMRSAMEMMLTGDAVSGVEAARLGFANRAFPADALEAEVLKIAARVAKVPKELSAYNKRSVHRAMEIMGARAAMRSGAELQALAFNTETTKAYLRQFQEKGVKEALSERDRPFGDYREKT